MKMTYSIVGLLLICGFAFCFVSCGNKSADKNENTTRRNSKTEKTVTSETNAYEELRNMSFKITPEQIGISLPADKITVYGVVMDWEMGGAIATTVAFQTGDASLYLSSGGGVIGGGQHESVSEASKQFISLAQNFIDKATKTETTGLPKTEEVKFYLLTNKGIYVGQDQMKNLESNSSVWLKLFEEGNNVLTELRRISKR